MVRQAHYDCDPELIEGHFKIQSMKNSLFILLLFTTFFSCQQKEKTQVVEKGFKLHRLKLGYNAGVVEFMLDERMDTLYRWKKFGDNRCDDDSIYRFQNHQTLFYKIPLTYFDTLPHDTFYRNHLGFNCLTIFVESCRLKQAQAKSDSSLLKLNKLILKQHKESFHNFKLDVDTLIRNDSLLIPIRLDHCFKFSNGKQDFNFVGDIIHHDILIHFKFQNTENPDSIWFRNCMKTFESIRFMK
jgi:hypothetical protein